MSQQVLLKAAGLYSFPNRISSIPNGALLKASNVIINRDNIAESRRGNKLYGTAFTNIALTAHQLFSYKDRILRHSGANSGTTLDFDSNGTGTFQEFSLTKTGNTNSSTTIDSLTSTTDLEVGMPITGSGIPINTVITSIDSNVAITISNPTTTSLTATSLTFNWVITETSQGLRIKSIEQNGNLYFTTVNGIRKISASNTAGLSTAQISYAGGVKALDLQLTIHAGPGFFSPDSLVAYRVLWGIKDNNQNLILGAPSERAILENTDPVNSKTVDVTFRIPRSITTAHFYQIYRTPVIASTNNDPGDEEQLVFESNPSLAEITAGTITVTDVTPEDFRAGGASLYTNENSGEGILQANDSPPFATDITTFKGYTFYSNTRTKQRLTFNLLSVSALVNNVSTFTISDGTTTTTYTFTAAASDASLKTVKISTLPTPGEQVNETARELVRIINSQASEIVYAYYLSSNSSLPGEILLEARNLNNAAFYLNVDSNTTGDEFNPAIPTSGNSVISDDEVSPNRVYYSKFQQPEAVPSLNFIDVGPKDRAVLRILGLRDNLFILKEDGVYRLSGQVAPFSVYPFDFSANIKAPDSAVILNNLIYFFSSQGVGTISDTGVSVISRPIEDELIKLAIPEYTNFTTATFGVSYESDRSYSLFTITNKTDTYATQCFRYNTFTNTWTKPDLAKRCGIVNFHDDKLYLGPTDVPYIEQERKLFDRTDYADRELSLTLGSQAVSSTTITLPSVTNISIGDVVEQVQYVTILQFNQLLSKLDRDISLSDSNYTTALNVIPGSNLSDKLDILLAKIIADPGRIMGTSNATYTAIIGTGSATFTALQTSYNLLISTLNSDPEVFYSNYLSILTGSTTSYEFNILSVDTATNSITSAYVYPLIEGPLTVYNHIAVEFQWVPQYFSDVSMSKQVSEGSLIFEDSSFTTATLSYNTDLSANFEDQDISGNGNGIFGNFTYGMGLYGGDGSGVPFRTYIPRDKQRCRYINVKFKHSIAREIFSLYGMSLTYNPTSQRAWR